MAKALSVTINGKEFVSQESKKAGDSLSNLRKTSDAAMNAMATGANVAAGAFTAAVGAVGALTAAAVNVAGVGDNIDKMSQKLGMSRQAYQEWDFIMSQSGASVDKLQSSMKKLADTAVDADGGNKNYMATFDALGISVRDVNGAMKDQETLFNETVIALQGVEDTTTRTAYASDLLGKSATELGPLLNGGTDALEGMRAKAHDLGLVIGDETIDAGVALTDTMDQMKRVMSAISVEAIGPLIPALNDIGQAFIGLMRGTEGSSEVFASSVADFIQTAMTKLVDMAPQMVSIGTQVLTSLISGISGSADQIGAAVTQIIVSLTDFIITNLPTVISAGIKIVLAIGDGLITAAPQIATSVSTLMKDIGSQIGSWAKDFVQYGKDIVEGLIQGLKDKAMAPIEAVKDVGNKIKDGFKSLFGISSPSKVFAEFGGFFMEGLAQGIRENHGLVTDALGKVIDPLTGEQKVSVNVSATSVSAGAGNGAGGAPVMDMLGKFAGSLGGIIGAFSSVKAIISPFATILEGVMEVLGPVIDEVLAPLVGILKIVGNVIGSMLAPVLRILTPVIELITHAFVWLYNKAIVPTANGFIWLINMIRIGFANMINGVIRAINRIPFVNIGYVSVPGSTDGFLSNIDLATVTKAGSTSGSSYAGGGTGSSTSVQSVTINVHQHYNAPVIGDGGMEQVGGFVVRAIQAYTGIGGTVRLVEA